VLIFILSLSQSSGLVSHPLSATLLSWARGRIWKKDELCIRAERRVIPLSAPLQSIRWARKARAKLKSTNARWVVHSRTKRASTNKATYLSLKSDFGGDFCQFLEELLHVRDSRERRVWIQRVWEILLCEDLQRPELEEEAILRELEMSLWVIVRF